MSSEEKTADVLEVDSLEDGAYWRVVLGGSKGNILDQPLVEALVHAFREAQASRDLKVVCLEGKGTHFSYGASVSEHLPGYVENMLHRFHSVFRVMMESGVVYLAAVRGQCLGGGMELASFCHRVFASPEAKFGQPEIRLGVFAPVASVFLPDRVGRGKADDLCLSGRVVTGEEALGMGLVDQLADDPSEAALAYAREYLLPLSASSLRHAARASRWELYQRFEHQLKEVERFYLEELMSTDDAIEGLKAFLERRPPHWKNA